MGQLAWRSPTQQRKHLSGKKIYTVDLVSYDGMNSAFKLCNDSLGLGKTWGHSVARTSFGTPTASFGAQITLRASSGETCNNLSLTLWRCQVTVAFQQQPSHAGNIKKFTTNKIIWNNHIDPSGSSCSVYWFAPDPAPLPVVYKRSGWPRHIWPPNIRKRFTMLFLQRKTRFFFSSVRRCSEKNWNSFCLLKKAPQHFLHLWCAAKEELHLGPSLTLGRFTAIARWNFRT